MEFAVENAEQHGELGRQVEGVRGELRIIKSVVIGGVVMIIVAGLKYLIGF